MWKNVTFLVNFTSKNFTEILENFVRCRLFEVYSNIPITIRLGYGRFQANFYCIKQTFERFKMSGNQLFTTRCMAKNVDLPSQ